MTRKRKGRPGRTKEELLPMHAPFVRNIVLQTHLSIVKIRNGHGMRESMVYLQRILYMTFFLTEPDRVECDDGLFEEVESILVGAIQREDWRLSETGLRALEQIVVRFDSAIGTLPLHRVEGAVCRLQKYVGKPQPSPVPGSRLAKVCL
jgi:hypothetical protein